MLIRFFYLFANSYYTLEYLELSVNKRDLDRIGDDKGKKNVSINFSRMQLLLH